MNKIEVEKALKKYLKKNIGYSLTILIGFLINGQISLAIGEDKDYFALDTTSITKQKTELEEKLLELDKELSIVKNSEDKSIHFLFSPTIERRRAKKSHSGNFNGKIEIPTVSGIPDIRDNVKPILPDIKEPFPNEESIVKEPNFEIGQVGNVEIDEIPENININIPSFNLPINSIENEKFNVLTKEDIALPSTGDTDKNITVENIAQNIKPSINIPKVNSVKDLGVFSLPEIQANTKIITAPENFSIKDVKIETTGIKQENGVAKVVRPGNSDNNAIVQNFGSYTSGGENSKGDSTNIRFSLNDISYGNGYDENNNPFYGNGRYEINENGENLWKGERGKNVVWLDGKLNGTYDEPDSKDEKKYKALRDYYSNTKIGTFINDATATDTTVNGVFNLDYTVMGDKGSTKVNDFVRMFLNISSYGIASENSEKIKVTTVQGKDSETKGEINLTTGEKNIIPFNGNLIAINHQLYDTNKNSYSVLLNKSDINLGNSNENGEDKPYSKNMIGIMVSLEQGATGKNKNHQTINNGNININGTNSIGFSFEEIKANGDLILRDDAYIGNINVNGFQNYGFRMANIYQAGKNYFDKVKVYGNTNDGNINYKDGEVISGYTSKIEVAGKQNVGMVVGKSLSANAGADDGKVNPIANFENISINVNGDQTIGFVRDKNYSDNNKNDIIIDDKNVNVTFGDNAKNSVLFRSEMYGITNSKILDVTGAGNKVVTDPNESFYNTVMQATRQSWDKDGDEAGQKDTNSSGSVTNNSKISGKVDNMIGMMASGNLDANINDWQNSDNLNDGKALATNTDTISFTGTNNIGMAILDNNKGVNSGTIAINGAAGVGVYNTGNFTNTGTISIDGADGIAIYNKKESNSDATLNLEGTEINISDNSGIATSKGVTGIYSEGGIINLGTGTTISGGNNSTAGVYTKGETALSGKINIEGTKTGIVADGGTLNITGGNITYNGDGFALFTKDGENGKIGKITLDGASKLTLAGNSYGYNIDVMKYDTNKGINFGNSTIDIQSNNVTIFNIDGKNDFEISSNNSGVEKEGLTGNLPSGISSLEKYVGEIGVIKDNGYLGYKIASIENGTINLDGSNEEFLKKYKFQKSTVNMTTNTNLSLSNEEANTYFNGEVIGIGISSNISKNSTTPTKLEDTQINIENSTLTANRKEKAPTISKDETGTTKSTIGAYIDYGIVKLTNGKIVVENDNTTDKDIINDNGIGIFSKNGSQVKLDKDSTITVYGNNGIGIYGEATKDGENGKNKFGGNITKLDINNAGTIDVSSGQSGVGIFAVGGDGVENRGEVTNSGTIKVGGGTTENSSVGIYGINTDITNTGNITVGSNADDKESMGVGIFAQNSSVTLGSASSEAKFTLGSHTTGVYLDGDSNLTLSGNLKFESLNPNATSDVIGIYAEKGTNAININKNIDMSNVVGGKAVVVDGRNVNINSDSTISISGNDGRGIRVLNNGTITNNGTIKITANGEVTKNENTKNPFSIGMVAANENGTIANDGTIEINSTNGIGIYVGNTTDDRNDNQITSVGTIKLNGNGNIGVVAKETDISLTKNDSISFGEKSENSIGIYAENSKITNNTTLDISGNNIGVYLKNGAEYVEQGSIKVSNGAIGIYANSGTGALKNINITSDSQGKQTIGVVLQGENTSEGNKEDKIISGKITLTNNSDVVEGKNMGIYANNSNVVLNDTLTLNNNGSNGTGIYLNDSTLSGTGTIKITGTGKEDSTGKIANSVGVYYASKNPIISDNNIKLEIDKSNTIGVYLANDTSLNKGKNGVITIGTTEDKVITNATGIVIANNSELTNSGDITLNNTLKSIGIASLGGKVNNSGTITLGQNTNSGTGVFLSGGATFNGENGTIKIGNTGDENGVGIGIYVKDNGKITNTGNFEIASGNVAIYSDGADINTNINLVNGDTNSRTTALVVKSDKDSPEKTIVGGTSKDDKMKITLAKGSIGIYALDSGVKIQNVVINANEDLETENTSSTGIYLKADDKTKPYEINNAEITFKKGIGIVLDTDIDKSSTLNLSNSTLNVNSYSDVGQDGIANKETGIGIYVKDNGTLNLNGGNKLAITDGIGIYGTKSNINLNGENNIELKEYSVGIYTKDSQITIGEDTKFTGDNVKGDAIYISGRSVNNSGNITITNGNKFTGIYSTNDGNITNSGNIEITGDSIFGLVASNGGNITNRGSITLAKTSNGIGNAVGIYSNGGSIENTGKIDVTNGIGIGYTGGDGVNNIIKTTDINLHGAKSIGVTLTEGKANEIEIGDIVADNDVIEENGTSKGTLGIYLNEFNAKSLTTGSISLGDYSMGLYINNSSVASIKLGNITVGKEGIGIASIGKNTGTIDDNVTIASNGKITVGDKGTAIYVKDSNLSLDSFSNENITVGENGNFVHVNGGTLTFKNTDSTLTFDGNIGIILENGGNISSNNGTLEKINVINGGTGILVKGEKTNHPSIANNTTIELGSGVSTGKNGEGVEEFNYSVGIYYKDANVISDNSNLNIDIAYKEGAHHTIGTIYDRTYGTINNYKISMDNSISDSIGTIIRRDNYNSTNDAEEIEKKVVLNLGTDKVLVDVNGKSNAGILVKNSKIEANGNINVGINGISSNSIGIYLTGTDSDWKPSYTGTGDINVGNSGIGIYAKNYDINQKGNITATGEGSVGIVGILSDDKKSEATHTINVDSGTLTITDGAVGVLGENTNINITNGKLEVSETNSSGIANLKDGDIKFSGSASVAGKGSAGIYKNTVSEDKPSNTQSDTITVGEGTWEVKDIASGIVAISREKDENGKITGTGNSITVNNSSDMTLGNGSIGIYSGGANIVDNSGEIKVGGAVTNGEDIFASIGIYMANGVEGTTAKGTNTGDIAVEKDGGVGIQVAGHVNFDNSGKIDVSNGGEALHSSYGATITNKGTINVTGKGIGMVASGMDSNGKSSTAINEGTINLEKDETIISNSKYNTLLLGMAAVNGGHIINSENGTINVNDGVGMYVDDSSKFTNDGTINVNNGVGIMGVGKLENTGKIVVNSGNYNAVGTVELEENLSPNKGSLVVNREEGIIEINDNFSNIGGILETDYNLKLNNPTIDITAGGAGFIAPEMSGDIKLNSNFALEGNGLSYTVEDFIDPSADVNINTSPLFNTELVEGDLTVNKVDYKDITAGTQFDNRDNSLDNILASGGVDADILKKLNYYLDSLGNTTIFNLESNRFLGAIGGNIYSNIQSRMQDVERTFDNSFNEMLNSPNPTYENSKFHLIYTDGDYQNSNNNIVDYDYIVRGVNYMKEYDLTSQGKKYGYTFGFTGAKFQFKDSFSSEEDIYSLKGGAHRINYYDNGISWETKGNIGYNHHRVERKVIIPGASESEQINNRAWYGSYQVSLDNKLRKELYSDEKNNIGAYTALNLEYGLFDDVKEKGNLELKVKSNDYFNSKAIVGVDGKISKPLNNDWSIRLNGDVNYSYDLGNNYDENKARFKNNNDYYSLSSEIKSRDIVSGKIGISLDKSDYFSVTLHGQASKDFRRDENYWNVGLTFTYRFNNYAVPEKFLDMHNYFEFDKSELTSKEKENIKEMAEYINKNNIKGTLLIEGHTDDRGKATYNDKLSLERANSVKDEFEKNSINKKNIQVKVKGYGESKPEYKNTNEYARSKNRRAQVNILNK